MRRRISTVLTAAAVLCVVAGADAVTDAPRRVAGEPAPAERSAHWTALVPGAPAAAPSPPPAPSPPAAPARPRLAAGPVALDIDGFLSWALLDRASDTIGGSPNGTATTQTESMIKVWLVADYLRRTVEAGRKPTSQWLRTASRAIRDSDDAAAEQLYAHGGRNSVVRRMIKTCRLTDTKVYTGWWSRTLISAHDAVRLGDCIADGRAAGPAYTRWLLDEMTRVRGSTAAEDQPEGGRWGIIDGLPEQLRDPPVSIKNGWTQVGGNWNVNCLAVTDEWVLAVLLRYPVPKGLDHGADTCAGVARQLVTR